jgi:hypothetical protein
MSQKHVELLMEAVALKGTRDYFLCNRIGYITGYFGSRNPLLRNTKYNEDDYLVLTRLLAKSIEDNEVYCTEDSGACTYESTTFYEQGMTRGQWAETVLAPLALEIEEN